MFQRRVATSGPLGCVRPIWWLGLPAILKGWIDRIFTVGRAYGGGRWFDRGVLAGKRAMCSVTVGGPAEVFSDVGWYAPIETILFPIHRGIFGFTGFTVIGPFVVYRPNRISQEECQSHPARYDAVANQVLQPANLRKSSILRYASLAVYPISQRSVAPWHRPFSLHRNPPRCR